MSLIEFYCPTHGRVMGAPDHALVECYCGSPAVPNGYTPAQWRKLYFAPTPDRAQRQRTRARLRRAKAAL